MSSTSRSSEIKSVRLLWDTVKTISAQRIFVTYFVFLVVCCGLLCLLEPVVFKTYGDAVWYVFQVLTTIGFGDLAPKLLSTRILTLFIGLSALFIVALITGIVVSYFNERAQALRNESFLEFSSKIAQVTTLDHDELAELEENYRAFLKKNSLRK